jgi:hypothetical protein
VGVWAFIRFLAVALPLLRDIFNWIEQRYEGDPAAFVAEIHAVMTAAKGAKTPEEKQNAARKIQDLLRSPAR